MKEVDDALLTALAENCRKLTHVSIKGCGLVSILNAVEKCSGEGRLLFVPSVFTRQFFYCKSNMSLAGASAYQFQGGKNLCKMHEPFLYNIHEPDF